MKGEHATEIFSLVKQKGMLPAKLEDLVPLSFIGQSAVAFYRATIKHIKDIPMGEEQRKMTLKNGQEAGELLLDIESRIGELAEKEERAKDVHIAGIRGSTPGGKPPKHERLGLNRNRMRQAEMIHKHPDVVAKVKAQAKKMDDIPTRTAVINEIRYKKEKDRQSQVKEKTKNWKDQLPGDVAIYILALEQCVTKLPKAVPKEWNEKALNYAKGLAKIIIKRLEVFNG